MTIYGRVAKRRFIGFDSVYPERSEELSLTETHYKRHLERSRKVYTLFGNTPFMLAWDCLDNPNSGFIPTPFFFTPSTALRISSSQGGNLKGVETMQKNLIKNLTFAIQCIIIWHKA
jgi:hypothetical protein